MHMEKKEDKWRKPRSVKGSNRLLVNCVRWSIPFVGQFRSLVNIGTLEKIRFGDVECGKLLHYKDTIHRRNKRPILRYFLTMML
ncbi:hypothetical protein T12_11181, partial [Trichinella patagoniensis]